MALRRLQKELKDLSEEEVHRIIYSFPPHEPAHIFSNIRILRVYFEIELSLFFPFFGFSYSHTHTHSSACDIPAVCRADRPGHVQVVRHACGCVKSMWDLVFLFLHRHAVIVILLPLLFWFLFFFLFSRSSSYSSFFARIIFPVPPPSNLPQSHSLQRYIIPM